MVVAGRGEELCVRDESGVWYESDTEGGGMWYERGDGQLPPRPPPPARRPRSPAPEQQLEAFITPRATLSARSPLSQSRQQDHTARNTVSDGSRSDASAAAGGHFAAGHV